jgi:hypothetical protein
MQTRSLHEHITTAEGTARFAAHAQRLLRLQRLLDAALPPPLRSSTRVANLREGKLIIHAANSAVAAKLRQLGPRFAELVVNAGMQISEIDIKVQARASRATPANAEPKDGPSITRKQALTELSRSLPADAPIRTALESLLQRIK